MGVAFATLVSASHFALPPDFDRFAAPSKGIAWDICSEDPSKDCGEFEVPLDYKNKAVGNITLQVVRYNATSNEHKLGTLFINPGGPGMYHQPRSLRASDAEVLLGYSGTGAMLMSNMSSDIMNIVDGRYDIISE
jgi:hypothetical protein